MKSDEYRYWFKFFIGFLIWVAVFLAFVGGALFWLGTGIVLGAVAAAVYSYVEYLIVRQRENK